MSSRSVPRSAQRAPGARRRPIAALVAALALWSVTGCGSGDDDGADVPPETSAPDAASTTAGPEDSLPGTVDDDPAPPDGARPAPDPDSLPEAEAPGGLSDVVLPDDVAGVTALFAELPDELLGAARRPDAPMTDRITVWYDVAGRQCGDVGFQAMDLTAAEAGYPPDWRAEHFVALFAGGADWDVEASGRDGDLHWVAFETFCGGEDMAQDEMISSTMWGDAGSAWLYSVAAPDATGRDALLTAFVDAAIAVGAAAGATTDRG